MFGPSIGHCFVSHYEQRALMKRAVAVCPAVRAAPLLCQRRHASCV
jgi:hypothetical protein